MSATICSSSKTKILNVFRVGLNSGTSSVRADGMALLFSLKPQAAPSRGADSVRLSPQSTLSGLSEGPLARDQPVAGNDGRVAPTAAPGLAPETRRSFKPVQAGGAGFEGTACCASSRQRARRPPSTVSPVGDDVCRLPDGAAPGGARRI